MFALYDVCALYALRPGYQRGRLLVKRTTPNRLDSKIGPTATLEMEGQEDWQLARTACEAR